MGSDFFCTFAAIKEQKVIIKFRMIMKRLAFIMLTAVVMSLTASAIPVKPGLWQVLTLADGTTVRAEARGSEYGNWWQDAEGQCYVIQDGSYVKIDRKTLAENIKKNYASRRSQSRRILFSNTTNGLGYPGWNSWGALPSNGEWDIPVLMVEFTDAKFKAQHTQALIQDYLTQEGFKYQYNENSCGSIRDYFVAQSQGKFKPNFKLLGKVSIDKSYVYYGKNGANDIDEKCQELPGDAMRAAKEQLGVDFEPFSKPAPDKWHVAGIPLICLLYAGEAESIVPEKPDLIWPHAFDLNRGQGIDIEGIGVHLNSYFVGNELVKTLQQGGPDIERLAGIGVFCHELGHSLGLPDWYSTDSKEEERYPEDDAFGNWSIMDHGCYIGDLWAPVGYTAYERSYLGWLSLGTTEQKVKLKLTAPNGEQPALVIPKSKSVDETEYFIVETRYPATWYPANMGSGLLLTRYAYDGDTWVADGPNNIKTNKRAMVITADNQKLYYNANPSNLFGNGVNNISDLKFHSGAESPATISNIQKNDDGSVEFDFDPGTATAIEAIHADSEAQARWTDLQGRRLQGTPTAKGIYIHNGKKVVRK